MVAEASSLWAIVLAAGGSSRLRRPKQLVHWRGESLIVRSVRAAQEVCDKRVVVVLGAHHNLIQAELAPLAPTTVLNRQWTDGLASSVQTGIAALPPNCEAALILTCDQPWIPTGALCALAQRWREFPNRAVASAYAHGVGVPAILPARVFTELKALRGDQGARAVLLAESAQLEHIPLPEAAFDVDDEESLRMLEGHEENPPS